MLWKLFIGALIGAIAGRFTQKSGSMGCITNIIAGLMGSFVGHALFGEWGPRLAGMAIVPSILGAIIVVAVASFFLNKRN